CGHAGIINTLRRAQEVAGVDKIYALVGGFHLAPAPDDYLRQVMAELKKFDLETGTPEGTGGTVEAAAPGATGAMGGVCQTGTPEGTGGTVKAAAPGAV